MDRRPRIAQVGDRGGAGILVGGYGSDCVCTGYKSLVALRALGGLGEAFYFPAAMSLLGDFHGPATRSRAMSIHQTSVYVGSIAGATFAAAIAERYGWRPAFLCFGGCGLVLSALLVLGLREPVRAVSAARMDVGVGTAVREVLRNRLAAALVAIFVGANFVAVIFLTWMPTFLYRKFGMTLTMAGFNATAYLQMASVVGVIAGGVLADRASRRTRAGRIQVQAVGLMLGVPFLFCRGGRCRRRCC